MYLGYDGQNSSFSSSPPPSPRSDLILYCIILKSLSGASQQWRRKRGAAGSEAPLQLYERGQRPPELMASRFFANYSHDGRPRVYAPTFLY